MQLHRSDSLLVAALVAGVALLTTAIPCNAGTVVRMNTSLGNVDIELFDEEAPLTVANFLEHVERGDYDNSFIHRTTLPPNNPYHVLGGRFVYEDGVCSEIPAGPTIPNEYDGTNRPNERGTIAMSKPAGLGTDSDSNRWFINIADHSGPLGLIRGGFTVFGRVLDSNNDDNDNNDGVSMARVDLMALEDLRVDGSDFAIDCDPNVDDELSGVPLIGYDPDGPFVPEKNLIFIRSISATNYLANVTSRAGNSVRLLTPTPATLTNVRAIANPASGSTPTNVRFPEGFFSFEVNGVRPGRSVMVSMELPEDYQANTFYMYGPTPDNTNPHWYEFTFNGRTGAEFFDNNIIVLHFVDGERGDADLTANGTIVDPGAPGIATATSSGGGGCTVNGTQGPAGRLDLWLLLLAVLAYPAYRIAGRKG